jgi:hypothetical protein
MDHLIDNDFTEYRNKINKKVKIVSKIFNFIHSLLIIFGIGIIIDDVDTNRCLYVRLIYLLIMFFLGNSFLLIFNFTYTEYNAYLRVANYYFGLILIMCSIIELKITLCRIDFLEIINFYIIIQSVIILIFKIVIDCYYYAEKKRLSDQYIDSLDYQYQLEIGQV